MPPVTPQTPKPAQPIPATIQSGGLPAGFGSGLPVPKPTLPTGITTDQKAAKLRIFLIVAIVLFVVATVFGIYQSNQLTTIKKLNAVKYDNGYAAGKVDQLKEGEDKAIKDNLTDTKTYIAPKELGEFNFAVPKSFSLAITGGSGKDRLTILSNPDSVNTRSTYLALRVNYRGELYDSVKTTYDKSVKTKREGFRTMEEFTVDGRKATRYTAQFDRREKVGTMVIVEVRDSTLVFQTDNNDNATLVEAFNAAVQSAKLP